MMGKSHKTKNLHYNDGISHFRPCKGWPDVLRTLEASGRGGLWELPLSNSATLEILYLTFHAYFQFTHKI